MGMMRPVMSRTEIRHRCYTREAAQTHAEKVFRQRELKLENFCSLRILVNGCPRDIKKVSVLRATLGSYDASGASVP